MQPSSNASFYISASASIRDNVSVLLSANTPTSYANMTPVLPSQNVFETQLITPLYILIFVLSVVGNMLVLFTLSKNKRMRTVTNVYLLNLVDE
ncbi:hypothetical protein HUJ05_002007 [Dendroctonus ponderosae]|nr:hypothetical protein HUJ05_002007 [Dendroctonus ponderosae]